MTEILPRVGVSNAAVWKNPADQVALVARPRNLTLQPVHDVVPLPRLPSRGGRAMPVQDYQRLRIGHRQRPQQKRLHKAVDRRIGPDAEREQQDRKGTECLVSCHVAETVADILAKLRQRTASSRSRVNLRCFSSTLPNRRPRFSPRVTRRRHTTRLRAARLFLPGAAPPPRCSALLRRSAPSANISADVTTCPLTPFPSHAQSRV